MEQEQNHKRVVEINGIKMEVDLRTARRVDHFAIGDPVKILITETHSSGPEVKPGVIVGFENFTRLPTIVVAYIKVGYGGGGLEFAFVNEGTKDRYEIVPSDNDSLMAVSRNQVLEHFDREILKRETEIKEFQEKRAIFLARFGAYFPETKASNPA